jgi:hypothetical protein
VVEFQTVYVVTDEVAVYQLVARIILLAITVGSVVFAITTIRNRPRPRPERRPWWVVPLTVAVLCVMGGLFVLAAVRPKLLGSGEVSTHIDRYEAGDYETTEGRVQQVEEVPKGHAVSFRITVGGRLFRCNYLRDRGRFDDVLSGTNDEVAKRFQQLLRDKAVRIRHIGDRVLQLELATGP